ncbi:MAG: elongation factor P [Acidobacteria bacterium]|nr:MAG: elongation factor P [Acidobacteriota bacterium]
MAIPATQIRRGMVIVFEGEPCRVVEFRHHTPGNLRAMIQTKLRSIRTGSSFEHRFRSADTIERASADTIERASLEQHEMEYLYSDGSHHHFMNTETFEQIALSDDELGDAAQWLTPGLKIQVEFYDGTPIGIDLPPSLELTVTQTEPSLKGATVSNVNKPATLENGVTIQVPPFVNEGDRIRVDPSEGRYMERAK